MNLYRDIHIGKLEIKLWNAGNILRLYKRGSEDDYICISEKRIYLKWFILEGYHILINLLYNTIY